MKCLIGLAWIVFGCVAIESRAAAAGPAYPATPKRPVSDTYHGVAVSEDYRWLEEGSAADVKAWIAAQNQFARAYLDAIPQRPAIARQVSAVAASACRAPIRLRIARPAIRDEERAAEQSGAARRHAGQRQCREGARGRRSLAHRSQRQDRDRFFPRVLRWQACRRLAVRERQRRRAPRTFTRWPRASGCRTSCRTSTIRPPVAASSGRPTGAASTTRAIRTTASAPRPTATSTRRCGSMRLARHSAPIATSWAVTSRGSRKFSFPVAAMASICSPRSATATAATSRFTCATALDNGRGSPISTTGSRASSSATTTGCMRRRSRTLRSAVSSRCRSANLRWPSRPSSSRRATSALKL